MFGIWASLVFPKTDGLRKAPLHRALEARNFRRLNSSFISDPQPKGVYFIVIFFAIAILKMNSQPEGFEI